MGLGHSNKKTPPNNKFKNVFMLLQNAKFQLFVHLVKTLGFFPMCPGLFLMKFMMIVQFFSQNFCRDSRQVCRPSAEIADKFMLYFTK
jgi:hypothetical protein